MLSISVKIVEPVVVNPDIVSKKASVKEGIEPLIKNGIDPKKENKIHDMVTVKKLSRFPTIFDFSARFPINVRERPKTKHKPVEINRYLKSGPWYMNETPEARRIKKDSMTRVIPRIFAINLQFKPGPLIISIEN
jgi:hypothetical protein